METVVRSYKFLAISLLAFTPVQSYADEGPILPGSDATATMECRLEDGSSAKTCELSCNVNYFQGVIGPSPNPPQNPPQPAYGSGFTVKKVDKVSFYQKSKSGGTDRSWVAWRQWISDSVSGPERPIINWAYLGSNIHCQTETTRNFNGEGKIIYSHLIITKFDP